MVFLILSIIRRYIFLIVCIIIVLFSLELNIPLIEEVQNGILSLVDSVGQYINLKGVVKQAEDAFNSIRKLF
ncbi:MAG: hypothetical protein K0R73_662 [Candidatus Midichloriaceae bacterium]|jgi:hypothetical protein|nr:hypothetical protein [Candidatus Midichloriaceae bacterium]